MARIEIKVVLDDETEIAVGQTIKAERRDGEAEISSIGSALLGSAVPSVIRALGLRTQQDEAELMEQVAARASEMLQQVRDAEAAEAAEAEGAEQDAQIAEALDKHLAEEAAPAPAPVPWPAPEAEPEAEPESTVGPEAPSGSTPAQGRKRDRR